jgi:hypothetical protein
VTRAGADSGHYVPGQLGLRETFVPDEGLHGTFATHRFTSRTLIGEGGGRLDEITFSLPPNFPIVGGREITLDIDVRVEALAFVGGLTWIPLDLDEVGLRYGMSAQLRFGQGQADSGVLLAPSIGETDLLLADPLVTPIWLGWTWNRVQLSASYGAWLPLGNYDERSTLNAGHGFLTHQVQGTLGLFYGPERFGGLICRATFEAHSELEDRVLIPGNTLTLEYGWSQVLVEYEDVKVALGVSGYSLFQLGPNDVSDRRLIDFLDEDRRLLRAVGDRINARIQDRLSERQSQVHAVGGELQVTYQESISVVVLGSYDYDVQNELQGWRIGISVSIQLGPLRNRKGRT